MFKVYVIFRQFMLSAIGVLLFISCNESNNNPVPEEAETGNLRIEFDNVAGDANLVLNDHKYYNQTGEDFIVTKFNYFVSNFKLYRTDGTIYTIPQDSSYFLIKEDSEESQFITLRNIPLGEYDHVEFMVGVDSLRNTMGEDRRTGVLDPGGSMMEDGMYWSWHSGYIFVKFEGTSSLGNPTNNKFYYHIGLYGGYFDPTVNNTRIVTLGFNNQVVSITTDHTQEISLYADVLKFFDGAASSLSIGEHNSIMASPAHWQKTQQIADNYQQMFSFRSMR